MPAAHFLGLRPRLVFAQYPDDLLLAEATPFHRPSPFSGDGLYLISAEFSGCRPPPILTQGTWSFFISTYSFERLTLSFRLAADIRSSNSCSSIFSFIFN